MESIYNDNLFNSNVAQSKVQTTLKLVAMRIKIFEINYIQMKML